VRVVLGGVIGAVLGSVLVWLLAAEHHWDVLPMDVQAAFSALIGGALSFLGGFLEHKRAEREVARRGGPRNGNGNGHGSEPAGPGKGS
jgi:H+/Cl- antiporter ClcA